MLVDVWFVNQKYSGILLETVQARNASVANVRVLNNRIQTTTHHFRSTTFPVFKEM